MSGHKGPDKRSWIFHPLELGFCGYSGSGKTTLLTKLIPYLGMNLGYVKHDVHRFSMDHPGKDTFVVKAAGAKSVFISNHGEQAFLKASPMETHLQALDFLDCDGVLVEGHKASSVPKILVLDEAMAILSDEAFRSQIPLAAVGPWIQHPELPWNIPYFQRDRIPEIGEFVKHFWEQKIIQRPIYGLVLTGGRSQRMGQDKAVLKYHGITQVDRAFELLKPHCDQVFVSCRSDQIDEEGRIGHPQILDQFLNMGPLSGILSAMSSHPQATWMVLACDLPYLDTSTLQALLKGRNPYKFATAFKGTDGFPEPLCTLYEPKAKARLLQFLAMDYQCPRKMLINSPVALLEPQTPRDLENVNEKTEYEKVLHDIRR